MTNRGLYGMSTFHFYRWNQLKVILLDSKLRTGKDVHRHIVAEWLVLQKSMSHY